MVLSLSQSLDVIDMTQPEPDGFSYQPAASDTSEYRRSPPAGQRIELDLRGHAGFAQLHRINQLWPELDDAGRRAWLDSREIILPPCPIEDKEVALLPGGAIVLRSPDAILVCDPIEVATFGLAEMRHLRRVLRKRQDVSTLMHTPHGVMLLRRVPKQLPPQAVTVVPNASKLPIRISFSGPIMIQWCHNGAVARPFVAAPDLLALAASVAAAPWVDGAPSPGCRGPVITSERWHAVDAEDRWRLAGDAVAERLSALVDDTVCDELRFDLMTACVDGSESLAARIAKALAVLPSCFAADPDSLPGAPPRVWRPAMDHIRSSLHPRSLLGVDELGDPLAAIRALRGLLEYADVIAIARDGTRLPGGAVALHSDAALFVARQAAPHGRLAVMVPTPQSPVELYALCHEAGLLTGGRVIGVAPCWGYCHRIDPEGSESGNAGWFGMGAGLDEADLIVGDIDFSS